MKLFFNKKKQRIFKGNDDYSYFYKNKISILFKISFLILLYFSILFLLRKINDQPYYEYFSGILLIFLIVYINHRDFLKHKLLQIKEFGFTPEKYSSSMINDLLFPEDFEDEIFSMFAKSNSKNILGGDFYNHIKDKEGNYWFAIGDSCGHDLSSHIFSVLITNWMNYYINICKSPKEVVENLNKELVKKNFIFYSDKENSIEHYASIVVMKTDTKGNFEHYGLHPNPVLIKKTSREKQIIETKGIFIGVDSENLNEESGNFKMESGDLLFLFTDGIFEQKNKNNKFFGERIYKFIEKESDLPIPSRIDSLFFEISDFSSGAISDDMTLMIIEKK